MIRWLVVTRPGFRGAEKTVEPTDMSTDQAVRRVAVFADTRHMVRRGVSLDCALLHSCGQR